jgi:hypothetical protein
MSVTIGSFKIGERLSIFLCLMVLLSTGNFLSCDVWAQTPVANRTGTLVKMESRLSGCFRSTFVCLYRLALPVDEFHRNS